MMVININLTILILWLRTYCHERIWNLQDYLLDDEEFGSYLLHKGGENFVFIAFCFIISHEFDLTKYFWGLLSI